MRKLIYDRGMVRVVVVVLAVLSAACAASKPPETAGAGSAEPTCEPGRCLADISRTIGEHRAKSRRCYDEAIQAKPDLPDGYVVINYEIDAAGVLVDATQGSQDDQLDAPDVVACLSGVLRMIPFAASTKKATTRGYHRFEFSK